MKNGFYIFLVAIGLGASIAASVADEPTDMTPDEQAQSVSQLSAMMKNIRMIPHFENGRPTGYDVVPADDAAPAPANVQKLQMEVNSQVNEQESQSGQE